MNLKEILGKNIKQMLTKYLKKRLGSVDYETYPLKLGKLMAEKLIFKELLKCKITIFCDFF